MEQKFTWITLWQDIKIKHNNSNNNYIYNNNNSKLLHYITFIKKNRKPKTKLFNPVLVL